MAINKYWYTENTQSPSHNPDEDYYHWLLLGLDSDDPKTALDCYAKAREFKPDDPFLRESMARARKRLRGLNPDLVFEESIPNTEPADPITASAANSPSRPRETQKPAFIPRKQLNAILATYFVAITTAEALTVMLDTMLFGLVIYGVMLVALLMYSAVFAGHREQRIFLTLAFAPLIRLISMAVPMQNVPVIYQYMLVGAPIFISIIFVTRLGQFKPADMGLTFKNLPVQLLIAPLGIVLGYVEYLVLQPKPLVSDFNLNSILVPAVILLVFTGLLEELVFRGLMQKAFITELGTWGGLFFVASVFAVLHFGYLSALDVLFVFCVAVIFGIIVLYSGSVVGVTLAHGLTNLTLFLIFPFLLGEQTSLTLPQLGDTSPHQRYFVYAPSPLGADEITDATQAIGFERSHDWLEAEFAEDDNQNRWTGILRINDRLLVRSAEYRFDANNQMIIPSADNLRWSRFGTIGEMV
jgi:hypothetical protein